LKIIINNDDNSDDGDTDDDDTDDDDKDSDIVEEEESMVTLSRQKYVSQKQSQYTTHIHSTALISRSDLYYVTLAAIDNESLPPSIPN
jgi:hypothetical protein